MGCGGSTNSTVTNLPSAEQSEAFRFRQNFAQQAIDQLPGGGGYFTNPANSPYRVTPEQQTALGGIQSAAANLPPDPVYGNPALNAYGQVAKDQWQHVSTMPYIDAWGKVAGDYGNVAGSPIVGPQMNFGSPIVAPQMNWGAVNGGGGFTPTAREYDPVAVGDMAAVDVARIDPAAAYAAAQRELSTISSPAIRNALQASGLGRSGAEAEALAREGVRLELPIQQQVLQSDAQANQLEAQIQSQQQQVRFLEEQKSRLQAQALSAQSYEQSQQIMAQLDIIDQQINAALAQAEFAGQVQSAIAERNAWAGMQQNAFSNQTQQAIAQRQAELGYGSTMLGQAAGLMGQQYAGQAAFGNQVLNNLTQQGAYIPQNQSQWYQNQMAGANANFQAASYPQQQAQQDWLNRQNFTLSSIGATPLPSQIPGGMSFGSQSQNPSAAQNIGTGLLAASMLWP